MSLLPYFYDDFEEPFRMMEREFFRPNSNPGWMGRNFFGPSLFKQWNAIPWQQVMRPMEQLTSQLGQLSVKDVGTIDDDEKFQVSVDVQHFAPEEINVKVVEGQVIVEGNHEEKEDEHGYVSRRFVRRCALPKGCLPDTVQSKLSSDGVLTVSAPKVLPLPSTGERIVPITQTGPVKKQLSSPEPQINEAAVEKSN